MTALKEMSLDQKADQLVRLEVFLCVSHLVSALASGYGSGKGDLESLCEQAFELSAPLDDYEEAAIQEGWTGPHKDRFGAIYYKDTTDGQTWCCESWQQLCEAFEIEPYQREVYEFWAVSDWLADKLEAKGEKVERDFANLTVWARCTTGQGIASDQVIIEIAREASR